MCEWREHVISGRRRLGSRLRSGFTALLLAAGCLTAVVVADAGGRARGAWPGPRRPACGLVDGVQRQLRRGGRVGAVGGELVLRHRHRLRDRRDREHHQLDQQRLPGRQRRPGAQGDRQRRHLDVRADREHPRRLRGAGRRRARDDRVDRAAQPGQRARLLAGVLGARLAGADRRRLAHRGRARHDGGRQRAQRGLADPARLGQQPRPRAHRLPHHRLPDRLQHLLGDHQPDQHQRRDPRVRDGRRRRGHHHRGVGRHHGLAGRPSTTASTSSSTWPWAATTRTGSAARPPRPVAPPPPARR